MIKKENYAAPSTEVELRLEGVIATSDPNLRGGVGVNDYDGFGHNGTGDETITW